MAKKGFYFNQVLCTGCRTCQVACKDKNDTPIGILFRNVTDYEVGIYPDVKAYHYAATCNHCADPACLQACSTQAVYVNEDDGTVIFDSNLCDGCKASIEACPYNVPQYYPELNIVRKCDACAQLRAVGELPACVGSCTMRALEFDDIDALKQRHPDAVNRIAILPDPTLTTPGTLSSPRAAALLSNPVKVQL
ncbi:MAG: 4Fe-4S dicluster domain-containing protein [Eggerthellaceae bacterium]|nr:4Fe-4S dicluster domain-containing protein [Eggerthellaceae bacterium]